MSAWTCNIGLRGRIIRGILGVAAIGVGVYLLFATDHSFWATGLCTLGLFSSFEAIVGWCAIRALGLRMPF